jgi:hypothetical protein
VQEETRFKSSSARQSEAEGLALMEGWGREAIKDPRRVRRKNQAK